MDQQYIRNFCIIAHIDHGKSTWPTLLITGTISDREMVSRIDSMDLGTEKIVTIRHPPCVCTTLARRPATSST